MLKQGTDAEYWSKAARWQAQDADNEFRTLAGRCMQGIGISGRKEAPDLLDSIAKAMKQPSVERWPFVRAINGELLEGAFFYAIIREEGRPAFLARFFGGGENDVFVSGGLWGKWSATPEGQKWNAWDDNFRKERGRLLRKANP